MPLSRRRGQRHLSRPSPQQPINLAAETIGIEDIFDRALRGTGVEDPPILYHYTTWEGAEGILRAQRFRATAHGCTNDPAELTSADAEILDSLRTREAVARPMARKVLRLFLDTYPIARLSASPRVYLACFSTARDHEHQWREYGDRGRGVCLGLRLFGGVPHPTIPGVATAFMPVDYRERIVRTEINEWLAGFTERVDRMVDVELNWRIALDTLGVQSAAWALATKQPPWAPEREVRAIFLVREGHMVAPEVAFRPDGTETRFIAVPVTRLPRMPVEEFIVGANQDVEAGVARATELLALLKYRHARSRVTASALWAPSPGDVLG
jgi:hypothetical protein